MLVFASLAVLVPLVISAVLAPAKAQTFEDIFAQFGKITPQLADTSIVATKPLTHDTCLDLVNSINALTDSVKELAAIVHLTPPLEPDQATIIVKALLETLVPIYAQTASQIVKAKTGLVAIDCLKDVVHSLDLFVKAIEEAFPAFIQHLPPNTQNASNLQAAITEESIYIAKTYYLLNDF